MSALLPTTRLKIRSLESAGVFWRSWAQEVIPAYQLCHNRAYLSPLSPLSQHKARQARWRSEWRGLPLHPQTQTSSFLRARLRPTVHLLVLFSRLGRLRPFFGTFRATSPVLPSPFPFPPSSIPSPARCTPLLDPPSTTIPCAIAADRQRRHHVRQAHSVRSDAQQLSCSNRRANCSSVLPLSIATRYVHDLPPHPLCDTPGLG